MIKEISKEQLAEQKEFCEKIRKLNEGKDKTACVTTLGCVQN